MQSTYQEHMLFAEPGQWQHMVAKCLKIGHVHDALYNMVWHGKLTASLELLYLHRPFAASHIEMLLGHLLEVFSWQSKANGKACHAVICHFSCFVHYCQHFLTDTLSQHAQLSSDASVLCEVWISST